MKANELMIWDWVYIEQGDELAPIKVSCIMEDNNTEWLHPIPLTAEILEKNGWDEEWINGGWCYNHKLRFLLSLNLNKDSFYLSITNHGVYIHYVHELQHALRLCGLNELADNFKV